MRRAPFGLAIAALAALAFDACGGGGGGGSGGAPPINNTTATQIAGRVFAGNVANATVSILLVDANARTVTTLATATTDASGSFTASVTGSGVILFVATGGTLTDPATGQTRPLGFGVPRTIDDARPSTLEALLVTQIVPPSAPVTLAITPVSTIASRRSIFASKTSASELATDTALAVTSEAVARELGIGSTSSPMDPRTTLPFDFGSSADAAKIQAAPGSGSALLGAAIGAFSQAAANAGADVLSYGDAVAADFSDGILNGAAPSATPGTATEIPLGFSKLATTGATSDLANAATQFLNDPTRNVSGTNAGTFGALVTTIATRSVILATANVAPDFDVIPDVVVKQGSAAQSVSITGVTAGTPAEDAAGQTVALSIAASDPTLFTALAVSAPAGGKATITFTPGTKTGAATITVTAKDNGGTSNGGFDTMIRTFAITITP